MEELDSPVLDLMSVRYLIASGPAVERLRTLPKFRHVPSAITDRAIELSAAAISGGAESIRVVEYRPASLDWRSRAEAHHFW